MSSPYDRAKFIIERNANGQAKSDADSLSLMDCVKYSNDPKVMMDAIEVLQHWAKTYDTTILFTGLDKVDYELLSPSEIDQLVSKWVFLYPVRTMTFINERLKGATNAS